MKQFLPFALALVSCTEPPPPESDQVTSVVEHKEIPIGMNANIDILFVIDNSAAMAPAGSKLAADYRAMIDMLGAAAGGDLPDVQIGVTTTDLGDPGQLRGATFLADGARFNWRRERNYDGALADAFGGLANVGASGAASTQPLAAMQRALSVSVNPGFVRPDAALAVVILTAGDDHGTAGTADIARALKALKTDPSNVMVIGGFGACDQNGIVATAAPRLAAFLDQFPNRSSHETLCSDQLPKAFALTNQLLKTTLGLACLENAIAPHACSSWMIDAHSDDQALLPECTTGDAPHCYSIDTEPQLCAGGGHQAIDFHPRAFPFSATVMLDCLVE